MSKTNNFVPFLTAFFHRQKIVLDFLLLLNPENAALAVTLVHQT